MLLGSQSLKCCQTQSEYSTHVEHHVDNVLPSSFNCIHYMHTGSIKRHKQHSCITPASCNECFYCFTNWWRRHHPVHIICWIQRRSLEQTCRRRTLVTTCDCHNLWIQCTRYDTFSERIWHIDRLLTDDREREAGREEGRDHSTAYCCVHRLYLALYLSLSSPVLHSACMLCLM